MAKKPGQKPKAHHKVPRFYLQGFTDPATRDSKRGLLWVYRGGSAEPTRMKPEKTAFETHFNSVRATDGTWDTGAEEYLAEVDASAASAWSTLLTSVDSLSRDQRETLAFFFAFLVTRTEASRTVMNRVADEVSRMALKMMAANYDGLSPELKRDSPGREELAAAADKVGLVSLSQNVHVANTFAPVFDLTAIFDHMNWTVLHGPPEVPFITSDNPVARHNPREKKSWLQADLRRPGIEVTVPLSADACLLLTWSGVQGDRLATLEEVATANLRTVRWAVRELYSPARLPWLETASIA